MGFHKPVFGTEILGGVVHQVLQQSPANLAVFVDRGIQKLERVLVALIGSKHDLLALSLAERMNRLSKTTVTILHIVPPNRAPAEKLEAQQSVDRVFNDKSGRKGVTLKVVIEDFPVDAVLRECAGNDLLILGVDESWGLESHLFGWRPQRIADESPISLLVVRKAT
jgi:nucleotide-binding universal stress UspA family protein